MAVRWDFRQLQAENIVADVCLQYYRMKPWLQSSKKNFHDNVREGECGRIDRAAHSPVREVLFRHAFNKVKMERGVLAERLDVLFAHLFPPFVGGVHVSVLADN